MQVEPLPTPCGLHARFAAGVVREIAHTPGATVLPIAGFGRFEERGERIAPYFPAIFATVLIVTGVGFAAGVF